MNNYIDVSPNVSKVLESFKSAGYSFKTAVTDIIDNSVDANAKNIDVKIDKTFMKILDDGQGMDIDTIKQALKLGSNTNKSSDMLGKFGFGLKAASFSQSNLITVSSKKDDIIHTVVYDLKKSIEEDMYVVYEIEDHPNEMYSINSGTLIIWEDLYRINNIYENIDLRIAEIISDLKEYISLVFSEFLRNGDINITFNNRKIVANDPFYRDHKARVLDNRDIKIGNEIISVKAYSLQRVDMESENEVMNSQGIYVYRNDRYIANIGWINKSKHPSYNKVRIKLSFGGNEDTLFSIDFKKSDVILPASLKNKLIEFQRSVLNMYNKEYTKKTGNLSLGSRPRGLFTKLINNKGEIETKNIYHQTFLIKHNIKSSEYNNYLKDLKMLKQLSGKRVFTLEEREFIYDMIIYMYEINDIELEDYFDILYITEPFFYFKEEILKFKGDCDVRI